MSSKESVIVIIRQELSKVNEIDSNLILSIPIDAQLLGLGFLDSIQFVDFVISLQEIFNMEIDFAEIDISLHTTLEGLALLFLQ